MAQAATKARAALQYDVANRLFFRLYQASNLMHKQGTRYVSEFGATTQQWAVIGALARPLVLDSGMTVKSLIEFLGVSRQNLAILLNRLDERRWIERVKDSADKRSRRIRLTAIGKSVWAAMQAPIEAFYGAALADLSTDEQVILYKLLDRLKTGLAKS